MCFTLKEVCAERELDGGGWFSHPVAHIQAMGSLLGPEVSGSGHCGCSPMGEPFEFTGMEQTRSKWCQRDVRYYMRSTSMLTS